MKDNFSRGLSGLQRTFLGFTPGQKVVSIVGTGALLLAGFMVFQWAAAPSYAPLFTDLASEDASAVIQELDAQAIPYKLSNGGNTIMVPRDQVYSTRITLSGDGLPSASQGGYGLLDKQGLSTSQFQEQTDFKRAMEGELSKTIEAIDVVDAAVVHLAMPTKEVFSDQQDPTTASVLVQTRAGTTMQPEQVQAVVNLVSASIDGLAAEKVTVADSTGKVLTASDTGGIGATQGQNQQVLDFQNRMTSQVQTMLDRVLGPGNSTVTVTPVLSFDKTVTESTRFFGNDDVALSESETSETLKGSGAAAAANGASGVVGADGQMDPSAAGSDGQTYDNRTKTSDNAVDREVERREAAPGGVDKIAVGIMLDTQALQGRDPAVIQANVASAIGIDTERGDTINVSDLPFDRTAEAAAAKELAASTKADKKAATMSMAKNGGLIGGVVLMVLFAWFQSRRKAKARNEATTYVVDQLKRDAADRAAAQAALEAPSAAMLALEAADNDLTREVRDEIVSLVERQPEDVAALLRGWLVERV